MKPVVSLLMLTGLSGCSLLNPAINDMKTFDKNSMHTSDANLRSAYILPKSADPPATANVTICAEPQPDAATQLAAKGGLEGSGGRLGDSATAKASIDYSTAVVQLAGRTSTVLLARDLLFNICLLRANNFIGNTEVATLYASTITLIGDIAATDKAETKAQQIKAVTDAVTAGVPSNVLASTLGYTTVRELAVFRVAAALMPMAEADRRAAVDAVFVCKDNLACAAQVKAIAEDRNGVESLAAKIGQQPDARIDALDKALKGSK